MGLVELWRLEPDAPPEERLEALRVESNATTEQIMEAHRARRHDQADRIVAWLIEWAASAGVSGQILAWVRGADQDRWKTISYAGAGESTPPGVRDQVVDLLAAEVTKRENA